MSEEMESIKEGEEAKIDLYENDEFALERTLEVMKQVVNRKSQSREPRGLLGSMAQYAEVEGEESFSS